MDHIALVIVVCVLALAAVICAVWLDNWRIEYDEYTFGKEGKRELRIAQLSDLHFPKQTVNLGLLLSELEARKVDIVVITGDFINRHADYKNCGALEFAEKLVSRFPVYFVEGNHERDNKRGGEFSEALANRGVRVISDRVAALDGVVLLGVSSAAETVPATSAEGFRILLAHRPERAERYREAAPDLILSGHAHGGQFRIFGRGVYAPNQGLFPKYTSGKYQLNEKTALIVSRGIGKSEFPFRLNNRPHVPIITIKY